MSKYIKKFNSIDVAKAADDLWSPNLTGMYTDEGNKFLCKSVGKGVKFKFVGNSLSELDYAAVYGITNNLTHVTTSNSATYINSADSYTATLSVESGYMIKSVIVTMNGVDVTSSVYSNKQINISSVNGPIVIIAIADVAPTYNVYWYNHTDLWTCEPKQIKGGETLFATSIPDVTNINKYVIICMGNGGMAIVGKFNRYTHEVTGCCSINDDGKLEIKIDSVTDDVYVCTND